MELDHKLYEHFAPRAREVRVEILSLGLGYTAVTTEDGGIGLAYTYFDNKNACKLIKDDPGCEGKPAIRLLERIKSDNPLNRSMALALINALNHEYALSLPEDPKNQFLFDTLGVRAGTHAAMVGYFGPLMKVFQSRGAELEVIDITRKMGEKAAFYRRLRDWAEVLFLTSTSLLNSTAEEILAQTGPNVKTVMLGPSTPMVPPAFDHLPVHLLAGTVPLDREKTLRAVRHGTGTPVLQRYGRKAYWSGL